MRLSPFTPGQFAYRGGLGLMLAALVALLALAGCTRIGERIRELERPGAETPVWSPPAQDSPHLALGNPTSAGPSDPNNFLIVGEGHVLSYNRARGTANWASWRTTAADLGERLERPDFRPDPRLPAGFRPVEPRDYSGSGFDRGHLVPSADRFADSQRNAETFYMSNIVPQTPALNQGPWEKLERYARGIARRRSDVYNIAGCYGDSGRLNGWVAVPTNCWKVLVVVRAGLPPTSAGAITRVIAADMPNSHAVGDANWRDFRTAVREIERRTGHDLLSGLPRDVQDQLETRTDAR